MASKRSVTIKGQDCELIPARPLTNELSPSPRDRRRCGEGFSQPSPPSEERDSFRGSSNLAFRRPTTPATGVSELILPNHQQKFV